MFTSDDEIDLQWYFLSAAASCGMRSTLGGQIDALEASAFAPGTPKTSTVWMAKPKRSFAARDVVEERLLDAARRERAVRARLQAIPHKHQVVLELQYGDAALADKESRVSVSLASATQAAMDSHEQACSKARRKGKRIEATVRSWVKWLCSNVADEGAREWMRLIVLEASADLNAAKEAYGKTCSAT